VPENPMGMFSGVTEAIVQFFRMLFRIIDFFFSRPKVMLWSILGFIVFGAILGAKDAWLLIAGIFLIMWGISIRRAEIRRWQGS